jgi:hypothetical protein
MNQDHAPLRMIQLQPDLRALIGFLEGRGMNIRYMKTWDTGFTSG